jgi:hypothetical protein
MNAPRRATAGTSMPPHAAEVMFGANPYVRSGGSGHKKYSPERNLFTGCFAGTAVVDPGRETMGLEKTARHNLQAARTLWHATRCYVNNELRQPVIFSRITGAGGTFVPARAIL